MAKQGQATRRERFLPYRYEPFGLQLRLFDCTLDEGREGGSFDSERHLLDLADRLFEGARIGVQVVVPNELLAAVLPPTERSAAVTRLLLAVRCRATHTRLSVEHSDTIAGSGIFEFDVTLRRSDLFGSVELVPFLVRAEMGKDLDGYATIPGARLASGRPCEVRLDRQRSAAGAYLDIRYVSFSSEESASLRWPETLFQLDTDEESPILWLNLDHSAVCEVLDSRANVGTRARVRDLIFDYLSHAVWTRLFHKAASDLMAADETVSEWQESVLRELLPLLFPEQANHESRIAAFKREMAEGDQTMLLQRLDAVLQLRHQVPKHMKQLVEIGQ